MRRAAKIDDNQELIVRALRRAGASVQSLGAVGSGCPDLLVGHRGRTFLIEVKDGTKAPSKQALNPAQKAWHAAWRGSRVEVARSIQEALVVLELMTPDNLNK